MSNQTMTTQEQIRADFFNATGYSPKRDNGRPRSHNNYTATVRSAFVEHVDYLHRAGIISSALANRATLGA